MNYMLQRLQFGSNTLRVPGLNDLSLGNQPAEIQSPEADQNDEIWAYVFSYQTGTPGDFHVAGQQFLGHSGATIKAWYQKKGGPPGKEHYLRIIPFSADGEFLEEFPVVDFTEPSQLINAINTDTITNPSVSATAHFDLPQLTKLKFATRGTNQSILLTTEVTTMVFDHYFVLSGANVINGNQITVEKGQSCTVLAIYREESSSTTKEIRVIERPRIPKIEWPQVIAQVVNSILVENNGEIWEHIPARLLADLDVEVLRDGIDQLGMRIAALENVKVMIASLAERR